MTNLSTLKPNLKEIGQEAIDILEELNLANLPGRPFDNAFGVFDSEKKPPSLIVMGLNGSLDDSGTTNKEAIENGIERPMYSNLENGLKNGWGAKKNSSDKPKKTLPERLKFITESLGFCIDETIYTNAILICSSNAESIRERADSFGIANVRSMVERSMNFHKRFTFKRSNPKTIIIHGNAFYSFSAANALRQSFQTSEVHFLAGKGKIISYYFDTIIEDRTIPTLAIPHMSRIPPDENVLTQFLNDLA